MSLTPAEIREIATEAAKEAAVQAARSSALGKDDVQEVVSASVRQTLIQLGIASDDPIEMQKDMQYLRAWRKQTEGIQGKVILTAVTLLLTGVLTTAWLGFKALLK